MHLKACDESFVPPLSSRVDLVDYAAKLSDKAVSFEAWQDNVLVGMVNTYLNDISKQIGFITNVSILKQCAGKGVASTLLQIGLEHARNLGFSMIRLEVSRKNNAAIRLYSRAGFKEIEVREDEIEMECELLMIRSACEMDIPGNRGDNNSYENALQRRAVKNGK